METLYRCPFCKGEIVDNVDSLTEHRKPGGDCDQAMDATTTSTIDIIEGEIVG